MSSVNPKCSKCGFYFEPELKTSCLLYKTCKKCRDYSQKWRDDNREKLEAKIGEKLRCECGMFIRSDWLKRHQQRLLHIERMHEQQQDEEIQQHLQKLIL